MTANLLRRLGGDISKKRGAGTGEKQLLSYLCSNPFRMTRFILERDLIRSPVVYCGPSRLVLLPHVLCNEICVKIVDTATMLSLDLCTDEPCYIISRE